MKDKRSLHLKVQELCDCYATSDPLREMSALPADKDQEEGALKWLALAVLHGINGNAKRISIGHSDDGGVKVVAKYRKSELPSPGAGIGANVFDTVKELLHLSEEGGKLPLALGIRDSSLDVMIKMERDGEGEMVTLEFPK